MRKGPTRADVLFWNWKSPGLPFFPLKLR